MITNKPTNPQTRKATATPRVDRIFAVLDGNDEKDGSNRLVLTMRNERMG
jgi:hypothetical protein